jgi:hypothetical protein
VGDWLASRILITLLVAAAVFWMYKLCTIGGTGS